MYSLFLIVLFVLNFMFRRYLKYIYFFDNILCSLDLHMKIAMASGVRTRAH